MQSQSHRPGLDPVVLLGSFYFLSFIVGCAGGPPLGPVDIGLPPGLGQLLMIVLLIAAATRSRRASMPASASVDSALYLLRDRHVRGEIDREDFLQRRRDLEEQQPNETRGANAC